MYDIAICDDEIKDREFLKKEIYRNRKFKNFLRIHEYGSGQALLKEK